jgi:hypothetical protein
MTEDECTETKDMELISKIGKCDGNEAQRVRVYGESRGKHPLIVDIGSTSVECGVIIASMALALVKESPESLDRRLCGAQSRCQRGGEENNK